VSILIALVPLILVIVGFVWGFWLILRKGEMVAQPAKMVGYLWARYSPWLLPSS